MNLLFNQAYKLRQRWRLARARAAGVQCSADVRLAANVDFNLGSGFHNCKRPVSAGRIVLGENAWIEQGAVLWAFDGSITLAPSVYLGPYTVIYGHGGVEIGDNTLVSMHCCILSSNHDVPPAGQRIRDQPDLPLPTRIGRDCWLGAGAQILGGTTIGDGCVIGAGAVVTKDLPPGAIALGVPARISSFRAGYAPS